MSLSSRVADVALELKQAAVLAHRLADRFTERETQKAQLFEAIAKLPDSQREALLLRAEGNSYEEIAEVLGVSVADVNNWLARGRAKLRVLMREDEEHNDP